MNIMTRKEAIAAGLTRYFSAIPCPHGHIAMRLVSGGCSECARLLSAKNNKKRRPQSAINKEISRMVRAEAKARGDVHFFTGFACRNGHISKRYVGTGECFECLKNHVPTQERKRATFLRYTSKKDAISPGWRADATRRYRERHPFRARLEKLFKTARIHAGNEGVELDFDAPFIEKLLRDGLAMGAMIVEPHSPLTASLDKVDVHKPISRANVQIVPWWYNRAKWRWSESDLHDAMEKFWSGRGER